MAKIIVNMDDSTRIEITRFSLPIHAMLKPDVLQKVLASLATNPNSIDRVGAIADLHQGLEILRGLNLKSWQRHKILDLFMLRATHLQTLLTHELQAATLPLSLTIRLQADSLVETFGLLAQGYIEVIAAAQANLPQVYKDNSPPVFGQAMQCLHRQLMICALISSPVPSGLWQLAFTTQHQAETRDGNLDPGEEFGRMLALSVAQPESFTPRELTFLIDYLQSITPTVARMMPQGAAQRNSYWLDPCRDLPPLALARRSPSPLAGNILFFECTALAQQAREHLAQLAGGVRPATLGLPSAAAAEDYRNALACAASRWSGPGKRQHGRRTGNYRVEVCAHSGTLWRLLSGDIGLVAATAPMHAASNWLVTNESPEGYTMLHVAGHCAGLRTGTALGIRHADIDEWRVCLVRWARSENPEHIELGLELMAPTARAVRLAYRGTSAPIPALLLPALPTLQRGEALLTARGHYRPGAFTLLADDTKGVRLFDCETGTLAARTSSIEIFEFLRQSLLDVV